MSGSSGGNEDTRITVPRRERRTKPREEEPRAEASRSDEGPFASGEQSSPVATGTAVAFDEPMAPAAPSMVGPASSLSNSRDGRSASRATQVQRKLEGMRILLAAISAFALLGLVGVALFPGTEHHGLVLGISFGAIALVSIPMFVRAMRATEFRFDGPAIAHSLVISAAVPGITLGLGMHSAVSGVFALGIMFFALNAPRVVVLVSYLEIAMGHAVLTVLALLGVIPTTGLRIPYELHGIDLILTSLWVEGMYAAALLIGLLLNARWSQMMAKFEEAVRVASAREALLREVRAEFDRAANLFGPGRFTGHEVGSYRLGEVIGRGGMGEVYAAERLDDGSEAAVKVLLRGMLSDREIVTRFQREARMVKNLRTPHVAEVFEVGGVEAGIPYIAMERLHGHDLAAMLRANGTLSLGELRTLIDEVAAGLEVAHAAGIVHRDLKPNNLFRAEVVGGTAWKILDFGVAKQTDGHEPTLTMDQILGTPQYMAPEQAIRDAVIDRRVDVHALAVITYRAVTGRMPWTREDVTRVLLAVATEVPPDPASFVEIPSDLALVLRVGLAKRPDDRFPTARAYAEALGAAIDGNLAPRWRDHAQKLLLAEAWGSKNAVRV